MRSAALCGAAKWLLYAASCAPGCFLCIHHTIHFYNIIVIDFSCDSNCIFISAIENGQLLLFAYIIFFNFLILIGSICFLFFRLPSSFVCVFWCKITVFAYGYLICSKWIKLIEDIHKSIILYTNRYEKTFWIVSAVQLSFAWHSSIKLII